MKIAQWGWWNSSSGRHLLSKHKALSSNPNMTKKKKKHNETHQKLLKKKGKEEKE
jgi:hypothetical protein